MRPPRLLTALLLSSALAGCSWLPEQQDQTADWSASRFYEEAKSEMGDGNYERAIELFGKLEARFPYGRLAEQAQLETAYAHYKAQETEAAVAAAERFIKLHPRHPSVDYAYYLRGLASFAPEESLVEGLLPQEDWKHDPAAIGRAFDNFRELVTRFPDSRYAADATQRMTYLRNLLARHELYVADYYMQRGAFLAAVNRAKYILENYQQTPSVPDALTVMVEGYQAMGLPNLAADAQRVLDASYPAHRVEKR